MLFGTLLTAALAPVAALAAELKISNPSSSMWWIAESVAELRWTENLPTTDASIFLINDNVNFLTTRTQLYGVAQGYQRSINLNLQPGINPGTGYIVQLCDPVNNTNIYVQSEKFEVKPKGSTYPTSSSAAPSSTGAATNGTSSTGTSNSTAPAATETPKGTGAAAGTAAPLVAVAAAGALSYFLA